MHRHPPRHGPGRASRRRRRPRSRERLAKSEVGDPRDEDVAMGALVSLAQRKDVRAKVAELAAAGAGSSPAIRTRSPAWQGRLHVADPAALPTIPGERTPSTTSKRSARSPRSCPTRIWTTPSRWPIAARAPWRSRSSPFDPTSPREFVLGAGAFHGRMLIIDRDQRQGIDRPRLAAARPGPRRPRPRRRRRGDGRHSRREALHAAHRAAGRPRVLSGIVQQLHPGRAQDATATRTPSARSSASSTSATR